MTANNGRVYNHDDSDDIPPIILGISICAILLFSFIIFFVVNYPPSLTLQHVEIYAFNVSTVNSTLTSNLQITISCQSVYTTEFGIHFKEVEFYLSYKNQQITPKTMIPPTYITSPTDVIVWSPHLNGTTVLVDPNLAASLAHDITNEGAVLMNVIATGRWKSDGIHHYHRMGVNCRAYVTFVKKTNVIGSFMKPVEEEECYVDVPIIVYRY